MSERDKQIEEKANNLAKRMIRNMVSREELYSACILMAKWADANPHPLSYSRDTEVERLQSRIEVLEEALKFYSRANNNEQDYLACLKDGGDRARKALEGEK